MLPTFYSALGAELARGPVLTPDTLAALDALPHDVPRPPWAIDAIGQSRLRLCGALVAAVDEATDDRIDDGMRFALLRWPLLCETYAAWRRAAPRVALAVRPDSARVLKPRARAGDGELVIALPPVVAILQRRGFWPDDTGRSSACPHEPFARLLLRLAETFPDLGGEIPGGRWS